MEPRSKLTHRLWIDPERIGNLVDGLGDTERPGSDHGGLDLPNEEGWHSPDPPRLMPENPSAEVARPAPVSEVSPDIQDRLNRRLARIRQIATDSGALASSPKPKVASLAQPAAEAAPIEDATPATDEPTPTNRIESDSPAPEAPEQPSIKPERNDNPSSSLVAVPQPWGATTTNHGTDSPAQTPTPTEQPAEAEAELEAEAEAEAEVEAEAPTAEPTPEPILHTTKIETQQAASSSPLKVPSPFFPPKAPLWEQFSALANWIEVEVGVPRLFIADELGQPIEARLIERNRLVGEGDLADLMNRAKSAIGTTETGIHLALETGDDETHLCVINCPSEEFPIAIGLLTSQRVPFATMLVIGEALERTVE